MQSDHSTNNKPLIELEFYQPEHELTLKSFTLPEEQKQFTGMPYEVIELSLQDEYRSAVVILANETPVGFFVLHHGEGIRPFSTNRKAILLRAYSIDHIHQGKGYAKESMRILPEFVKKNFPDFDEIVLAVNESNHVAKQLYLKSGFQDHGLRRQGPIGMQYILQYSLK